MMRPLRFCVSLLLLSATVSASLYGQADFGEGAFGPANGVPAVGGGLGSADSTPALPDFLQGFEASPAAATATVQFTGAYRLAPDERSGILTVTVQIPERHHIFSLTQKPGAPAMKSTLTLIAKDVVELDPRGFVATPSPHEVSIPGIAIPTEEHAGKVEWSVPFQVAEGVELNGLPIGLRYDGQICRDPDANGEGGTCMPLKDQRIEATFAGMLTRAPQSAPSVPAQFTAAPVASENAISTAKPYRAEGSSAAIEISISPRVVQPGEQVTLSVKAVADEEWHVYALEPTDPKKGPKPTLIVVENPQPWMTGAPVASAEPIVKKSAAPSLPDQRFHDEVTWTWTWTVPKNAAPGLTPIDGLVGYQTCMDDTCQAPLGVKFSAQLSVGAAGAEAASKEIAVEPTTYSAVAKLALARKDDAPAATSASVGTFQLNEIKAAEASSLWIALGWAFLGGLILNVMPCVLPVLGLKVYSFIEMAGESRAKVFWHNVAYIFGLLVVFWILATVAILFQTVSLFAGNATLTLSMIGIVFAMALSFLGLWEIPIPGFSGTSQLGKLADKESLWGAFFKGVIATILATPCGAPLMSLALTQIFGRNPAEVYLIFTSIGIGMAFPYFVIALNPQIIAKVLPRPGNWMIVFKQALAFLLLGTVAWLVSTLDVALALPSLVYIFGVWLACWIVGTAQHHFYGFRRMAGVYFASGLIITLSGALAFSQWGVFGVTTHRLEEKIAHTIIEANAAQGGSPILVAAAGDNAGASQEGFELAWEPFSFARLQELASEKKTVVVDFTADWCPNCKVLEATVLNTQPIKEKVDSHGVVTLVADYTDRPKEIHELLTRLTGSDLIPVLAIFPAGKPQEPIVLTGGYTTATLLAELDKAGASAPTEAVAAVADAAASGDDARSVAVVTPVEKAR